MTKFRLGSAALVTMWALASSAGAQTSPSADQIINQLKPSSQALQGSATRGIRPIGPSAANAGATNVAPPSTAPKAGTQAVARAPAAAPAEAPSVNLYVPFENGSAELTPAAVAALDELGKALSSASLSGYKFKIEGHTDTVGSKGYNLSLSERRAAAVSAYLEQKYGLSQTRLVTVGLGSSHLLVPTPDQTPEPRNRRVTVINLGA